MEDKIKEVVFVGPDMRRLMKNKKCEEKMKSVEKDEWVRFKDFGTLKYF